MDADEIVQWTAQPNPSRYAMSSNIAYVFAAFWWAFIAFILTIAPSLSLALWLLPFAAFGVWVLTVPFSSRRAARSTVYAITNRRALILVAAEPLRIHSFPLEMISHLERSERSDGSGDLILRHRDNDDHNRFENAFIGIANVREPEQLIRKLQTTDSGGA